MSTSALLASLAMLYGIAQADPAVFTSNGADLKGAVPVPAFVAAGRNTISLSNPNNGATIARPTTGGTMRGAAGIGRTVLATAAVPGMQPFDVMASASPNGFASYKPGINGSGAFTPGATGQPLFTGLSFAFGAELYTQQPDPDAAVPEPSTQATIMGFVGLGFMPYLLARAMLSQPDRSLSTVRSE